MKRSLQWRLTSMLGGSMLIAGIVLTLISFILAYSEAKEFQDDVLKQVALLNMKGINSSSKANKELRQYAPESTFDDPESRISVLHLPLNPRPKWLGESIANGFHTLKTNGDSLRVFLRKDSTDTITMVTQPTEIRNEIAINSALRTLAPLLLLLPLMAWLIMRIVRKTLLPVNTLAHHVDVLPVSHPSPLPHTEVPDEIVPFVHAINRLLQRVSDLMNQQRRFIADAAHEMRSPLAALSLQAQNVKQSQTLESMGERISPLIAGIERASNLTEQLLNLARIQAGTAEKSLINVSQMSRQLIAEYLPIAEKKSIDLGLDEAGTSQVHTIAESLRLIIKNALENALKYTPQGGEITLKLYSENDNSIFEIIDNGPGIINSELERAFDPFYRLPGVCGEGSGLGLAIAKEAATALGGNVSLHNREDGPGLIFRYCQRYTEFSLPPSKISQEGTNLHQDLVINNEHKSSTDKI